MIKFIKNEEDLQRVGTQNYEKLENKRNEIYQLIEDHIGTLPSAFKQKVANCEIILDFKEDHNGEIKVDPITVGVYRVENQDKERLEIILSQFLRDID